MTNIRNTIIPGLLLVLFIFSNAVHAKTRIVILDFELNDITSLPNTQEERVRTASIKPLLEQALSQMGNYEIVAVNPGQQKLANPGLGYLFRFHDESAKLGKQLAADWIIVGQHGKPSFFFSYLMAQAINVRTGKLCANFEIEMKGNHVSVTKHGIKKLAKEIDEIIAAY